MKSKTIYNLKKLFVVFILFSLEISAQIQIKLINIHNNQPIHNASIFDENKKYLGIPDEQGVFTVDKNIDKILILSEYFEKKSVTIGKLDKTIYLYHPYQETENDLKALRILKKMWEKRLENNPDHLNNYQFDSYVKFTIDVPSDSVTYISNPRTKLDSLNNNLKNLLEKSKAFIGERTMLYKYDKKYGKKAIITSYKAGGFDNPELYNIATSQSIINNYPEILKPREIQNNISKLTDSIYLNGRKTYVIFTHSIGKSETQFYRSLTVFVDAENYALAKLIGNTSKVSDVYYEIVYSPYQGVWKADSEYMKTKLLSNNFISKINKILPQSLHSITKLSATATVDSYFLNFNSPVYFNSEEFKGYEYEILQDVSNNPDSKLSVLRLDSLSLKEASTYNELNRLSKKYKVEPKVRFLRSLSSGELELGPFSLDVYSIFSHNLYESFRYQIGGHTNYKLSPNYKIGGYIAKGSLDKEVKSGGEVSFFINKKQGGELNFKAETDVLPAGRTKIKYLTPKDELSAKPNNIYNDVYFTYRKLEASYQQDFLKNVDITFSLDYQRQRSNFNYQFKDYDKNTWFNYVNTAVRLRYAPNVKYIETPYGRQTLQDAPPYYYLSYSKTWNLFDHSTSTHRLYLSTLYSFLSKFGKTEIIGNIGATFGETPIMNTYEGMGVAKKGNSIWHRFSVRGFQSFETMRPSTYFSDKFFSIQVRHELRPIRVNEFKSLFFSVVYKGLIGTMENKDNHKLFEFEVPKNYYQEIGLEANKLLLGLIGAGIYFRIGAYQLGNLDQNIYIKLTTNL